MESASRISGLQNLQIGEFGKHLWREKFLQQLELVDGPFDGSGAGIGELLPLLMRVQIHLAM